MERKGYIARYHFLILSENDILYKNVKDIGGGTI